MKKIVLVFVSALIGVVLFAQPPKKVAEVNIMDDNGLKQGVWEEKVGEMTLKGFYINNIKEGSWVKYAPGGKLTAIDTYVRGIRNGISIAVDQRRGHIMAENWYKDGKLYGMSKHYAKRDRLESTTEYVDGMKNGVHISYYEDGDKQQETNYIDDVKSGDFPNEKEQY